MNAKAISWNVTQEQNIHTVPKYHPGDRLFGKCKINNAPLWWRTLAVTSLFQWPNLASLIMERLWVKWASPRTTYPLTWGNMYPIPSLRCSCQKIFNLHLIKPLNIIPVYRKYRRERNKLKRNMRKLSNPEYRIFYKTIWLNSYKSQFSFVKKKFKMEAGR